MADRFNREEFSEEEVWAVVKERLEGSPKRRRSRDLSKHSSSGSYRRNTAPINIPEWSKVYNSKSFSDGFCFRSSHGSGERAEGYCGVADGDDEDEDEQVPPHEWIARKLAKSQISSFSVCEGAGRTLKGRDLRRVRNAVLTRTGFLE